MVKRIAPALLLFVLSPLIAEYLSGSMSMSQIGTLPFMAMLYGGGAILARELARRMHRGWATILLLGLAYGIIEEGLADQALFNPHFLGLRLLDYGYVPVLGMGVPWTLYVLTIHIVWSIMVPIALVEILFRSRPEPWLRGGGLAVVTLIYAAGIAMITMGIAQQEHFMPTTAQLAGAALAVLVSIGLAFMLPAPRAARQGGTIPPWTAGVAAFVAGSAFVLLYIKAANEFHWPWLLVACAMAACAIAAALFGLIASRRSGWSEMHRFAMAAGAVLVYCWFGFIVETGLHKTTNLWPHAALAAAILGLLIVAGLRARPVPA